MTPDRWQQVEKLCQAALELEESQRKTFLDQACAGDEELRREVESLLKFDQRGGQFIEEPALEVAAKMIAQDKPESLDRAADRLLPDPFFAWCGRDGCGL